jgi:hypothetical protein
MANLKAESSVSKAGLNCEGNDGFCLTKYLFSYFSGFFIVLQNLSVWGRRLYFPFKGNHAADF